MRVAAARAMAASSPVVPQTPQLEPAEKRRGGRLHLERDARTQAHVDHIGTAGARFDRFDVRGLVDDPFAVQQPGREPFIVARRPHGRAERDGLQSQGGVVQLELERRLDGHPIVLLGAGLERGAQHANR